jgi:hypothetical protein
MIRLRASLAVVCVSTAVVAGCGSGSTTTQTKTTTQTVTVTESQTVTAAPAAPKPKKVPGVIVLHSTTVPQTFGPITFKPGGYRFRFSQAGNNGGYPWNQSTSFVVDVTSKPNTFNPPYELLVNASAKTGSKMMTVSGRLYVEVSSGDNAFVITFTPLH